MLMFYISLIFGHKNMDKLISSTYSNNSKTVIQNILLLEFVNCNFIDSQLNRQLLVSYKPRRSKNLFFFGATRRKKRGKTEQKTRIKKTVTDQLLATRQIARKESLHELVMLIKNNIILRIYYMQILQTEAETLPKIFFCGLIIYVCFHIHIPTS